MDIPRIFTISESAHRIHNPITPEQLALLGAARRLEPRDRVLDLGSGSREMLCSWASDHGIAGTGVDISRRIRWEVRGSRFEVRGNAGAAPCTLLTEIRYPTPDT